MVEWKFNLCLGFPTKIYIPKATEDLRHFMFKLFFAIFKLRHFLSTDLFDTRETQLKLLLVWIASVYPGPGWSREFEESVPNLNLFRWNCSTLFSLCDHYSLVVITCPWTFAVNWINNKFSHPFLVIYFNIFFIICFACMLIKNGIFNFQIVFIDRREIVATFFWHLKLLQKLLEIIAKHNECMLLSII